MQQGEFADTLGVKRQAYAAWEAGISLPRGIVSLAKRVELAYGVSAGWILGTEEAPTRPKPGGDSEKLPRLDSNQEPTD
ncbi:MAG: helix-turn-helix transcriptional regulator [Micropruina sp.]|nr:helix-turn-helix transcriptional regulator [Micropruina sp.]